MKLIYLKEGRRYSTEDLRNSIAACLDAGGIPEWLDEKFLGRLKVSFNREFDKTVVKGKNGKFVFHYLGLYDYTDEETGRNLTFFFLPKFIDFQEGRDCRYSDEMEEALEGNVNTSTWKERIKDFEKYRNVILRAIDRYNKEQNHLSDLQEVSERKRESVLELAVRLLRDALENGVYAVQRRELERNGQGEIDWDATINQFQPTIRNGRPYYMDTLTSQAYSDEEHYITRLHKCLLTEWGRKLEELGLSSVLRVNVPLLSEEQLEHFGDANYQIEQINRELGVQFVTKSRETLILMKELIQRSSENQAANYESLSFGMTGIEHLWETACAKVLGTELEKNISDCGIEKAPANVTFSKYMPRVMWTNLSVREETDAFESDEGSQRSKKAGWRLDFIRTWRPNGGQAKALVILDAKYYCATWDKGSISGQPGTPDIAKQIFYQMSFDKLLKVNELKAVNAFLLPEEDGKINADIAFAETVELQTRTGERDESGKEIFEFTSAFQDVHLFTVRIPGIRLLERYGNDERADDWFAKIAEYRPSVKNTGEGQSSENADASQSGEHPAEQQSVESTDNEQSLENADVSQVTESTCDVQSAENAADNQSAGKVNDSQMVRNTADMQTSENTDDGQAAESTGDNPFTENPADSQPDENMDNKQSISSAEEGQSGNAIGALAQLLVEELKK